MTAPPGSARTSTTAPAGSRDSASGVMLGPRIVAREFARLFAARDIPVGPAEIRHIAAKFCATGRPLSGLEAIVIAYADPTGETAARNVDRARREATA